MKRIAIGESTKLIHLGTRLKRKNVTRIFWNSKASRADTATDLREELARDPGVQIFPIDDPEDVRQALQDSRRNWGAIVAAGGDGTVNLVARIILELGLGLVVPFGVIPLGTGNNFARGLNIPNDPLEAARLIRECGGTVRSIDVAWMTLDQSPALLLNSATAGFSGEVLEEMEDDSKRVWGALSYLKDGVKQVSRLSEYRAEIAVDGGPARLFELLNLVISNGAYAGSAFRLAPDADWQDGVVHLAVIETKSIAELSRIALGVVAGNGLPGEAVHTLEVRSATPLPVTVDGESFQASRIRCTVDPRALFVLAARPWTGSGAME